MNFEDPENQQLIIPEETKFFYQTCLRSEQSMI